MKKLSLGVLSGLLGGAAAAFFLFTLELATQWRDQNPSIIWLLPLAGLTVGFLYQRFGSSTVAGTNLVLEQIHEPTERVPLRMAPLIWAGTVLTHLFGGSAGREGTAVQMSASLTDQLGRFFSIGPADRRDLLCAGLGAGFGAAIGAPWAGALFGIEVPRVGALRIRALPLCLVASFVAYGLTRWLGAPHSVFSRPESIPWNFATFFSVVAAAVAFGLAARFFVATVHAFERVFAKLITDPPIRPVLGGLLLVMGFWLEGSGRFVGLGLPVIDEAFARQALLEEPFLKAVFTAVTLASGFKGGEFVPLVFVGATLGSALTALLPASPALLGALGFAAVFGAAAQTPLACAVMAMELFGWHLGPYALVAGLLSAWICSAPGLYSAQKAPLSGRFARLPRFHD